MTVPSARDDHLIVEGAQLYVKATGLGRAVILIHGWTLDHRMWSRQVTELERQYRVIHYDRRGFGRSSGIPVPTEDLHDLDALIECLTPGSAVLCGASQGARVAMRYTSIHPDRVAALIVQGAPLDGFPPPADSPEVIPIERWAALAAGGEMDRVRAEWLKHPLMATALGRSELRRELKAMVDDYAGSDLLHPCTSEYLPSIDLSRIQVPTLILEGENETAWRRRIARKLAEEIEGAKLETIVGAGHLANMDRPEEFNRLVLEFLSDLP